MTFNNEPFDCLVKVEHAILKIISKWYYYKKKLG